MPAGVEALSPWDGVAEERVSTRSQVLAGWQLGALMVTSRGGVSSGFHFWKIFWSLGRGISWSTGVRPRVGALPSSGLLAGVLPTCLKGRAGTSGRLRGIFSWQQPWRRSLNL